MSLRRVSPSFRDYFFSNQYQTNQYQISAAKPKNIMVNATTTSCCKAVICNIGVVKHEIRNVIMPSPIVCNKFRLLQHVIH